MMKTILRMSITLIIGFVFADLIYAAEVTGSTRNSENDPCHIDVNGEIDANTPSQVLNQINALKPNCSFKAFPEIYNILVDLNGPGGDVIAAIKTGEIIRANQIKTFAVNCASACVIAFLGGVERTALKIGLHRPFAIDASGTSDQAYAMRDSINTELSKYFERMGITARLLDAMNAISPGDVRWLEDATENGHLELINLNLTGNDIKWEDARDSMVAKKLNMSLKEYYSRQQKAGTLCTPENLEKQYKEELSKCGQYRDKTDVNYLICWGDILAPAKNKCEKEVMSGLR